MVWEDNVVKERLVDTTKIFRFINIIRSFIPNVYYKILFIPIKYSLFCVPSCVLLSRYPPKEAVRIGFITDISMKMRNVA